MILPLHLAALRLDAAACQAALRDGADPNGLDTYQRTPLGCALDMSGFDWSAVRSSFAATVGVLLEGGAEIERLMAEVTWRRLNATVPPIGDTRIAPARSCRL